jgi:hypothetical protein
MSTVKKITPVVGLIAITGVLSRAEPLRPPDDTLPLVVDFELDGEIGEWRDLPVRYGAAELGDRGRDLRVWVGQVEGGIAVAGEGSAARFDPATGSGVGFWLADATPPEFPPVGWGHQFGYEELSGVEECAEYEEGWEDSSCREWFNDQLEYRRELKTLFVRRWQADAWHVRETYAGPAWSALDSLARDRLQPLEPHGEPSFEHQAKNRKTQFELFLPWAAFPPLAPPTIDSVRIAVDLPPTSSVEPPILDTVLLAQARQYRVTRCELGERAAIIRPVPNSAFRVPSVARGVVFRPIDDRDLTAVVILDNEAGGYLYTPDSTIASPVAFAAEFYTRDLEDGGTLCGPVLAYRADTVRTQPKLEQLVWAGMSVDGADPVFAEHQLAVRRLPDGSLLVKEGPWIWSSYYGSGQCGGCPRVSVGINHIDTTTGVMTPALLHSVVAEYFDTEMTVSPDWVEVTVYESEHDYEQETETVTWTATTYCYQPGDRRYDVCAVESPAGEPTQQLWLGWDTWE